MIIRKRSVLFGIINLACGILMVCGHTDQNQLNLTTQNHTEGKKKKQLKCGQLNKNWQIYSYYHNSDPRPTHTKRGIKGRKVEATMY